MNHGANTFGREAILGGCLDRTGRNMYVSYRGFLPVGGKRCGPTVVT